ncbi:MAG: hypothetical protein DI626_07250, partial [Micavibrio aeruginosavorus]
MLSLFRKNSSRVLLGLALASSMFVTLSTSPAWAQEEKRTATQSVKEKLKEDPDANDTYKQLNLFGEVFERVRGNYVDP